MTTRPKDPDEVTFMVSCDSDPSDQAEKFAKTAEVKGKWIIVAGCPSKIMLVTQILHTIKCRERERTFKHGQPAGIAIMDDGERSAIHNYTEAPPRRAAQSSEAFTPYSRRGHTTSRFRR